MLLEESFIQILDHSDTPYMFGFNPFSGRPRAGGSAWFLVGSTSSFPDIVDDVAVGELRPCTDEHVKIPGCKVYHVPKEDATQASEIVPERMRDLDEGDDLKNQVMVFKYKGKMFAVNHECPHSSFPLSKGSTFDIEDFGVTLSSGITCPKHGWSFDLFTGMGDRGNYKLQVWQVELRPKEDAKEGQDNVEDKMDVWIRRKPRMG